MQLSIRGHHQFDLPGQIQLMRLSTGFLTKVVLYLLRIIMHEPTSSRIVGSYRWYTQPLRYGYGGRGIMQ